VTHTSESPARRSTGAGAQEVALRKAPPSTKSHRPQEALTARVLPDGEPVTVSGREAQTLRLLLRVGVRGFTSGEASPLGWARRTSHYVWKLRAAGFPISTQREVTPDGCRIGRYALTGPVVVEAGA
jgi:hypothetical protein